MPSGHGGPVPSGEPAFRVRLTWRLGFRANGTHRCIQDGREVSYSVLVLPRAFGHS
jgi:hypothetical protein